MGKTIVKVHRHSISIDGRLIEAAAREVANVAQPSNVSFWKGILRWRLMAFRRKYISDIDTALRVKKAVP